jgi:hypothetical protein
MIHYGSNGTNAHWYVVLDVFLHQFCHMILYTIRLLVKLYYRQCGYGNTT